MQQIDMADNAEHQLLAALLTSEVELPHLTSLLQSNTKPEASSVKRKRKRDSAPVVHRETASQHKRASDTSRRSGEDTASDAGPVVTASAPIPPVPFSHDDPLIPELLSWISCAAILGGLAGAVAVASCCEAIKQANGIAPAPGVVLPQANSSSDTADSSDEDLFAEYEQDTPAGQALGKVMDDLEASSTDPGPTLLPALKRRNSGKRNLHKPWTAEEEQQLVRLVEQADHRKQVLNISRVAKTGWAKIAHHLGRSGASAVPGIKLKYRTLKQRAHATPARDPAAADLLLPGRAAAPSMPASPFASAAAVLASAVPATTASPATAAASPAAASPAAAAAAASTPLATAARSSRLTACALAILGLQRLTDGQGTSKQIMTAIESIPELAHHLNWDTDQSGKVRWRNGVTCALSAEKSGIFKKTGRKREGQIVWCLDEFKAKSELKRYADVVTIPQA